MADGHMHPEALELQDGGSLRCRLAPSPTGRMHAGNIFAALVSWLVARRFGGEVVLRIDDLDQSRCRDDYVQQCIDDFALLGLDWDEAPLRQSARTDAYREAFEHIAAHEHTYPCFCTRANLHAASAPHEGEQGTCPGQCRMLDQAEAARKRSELAMQGRSPSVRLAVPDAAMAVDDAFQGRHGFNLASDCGDCVMVRADGGFSYHLATVVDDASQRVSMVVRGCDLLQSTPVQMHLAALLGLPAVQYAHVPLLVAPDGRRLAKRDADAGLPQLLERYGSPQGVLGHVAFVAGLIDEDEPVSTSELRACARLEALCNTTSIPWT